MLLREEERRIEDQQEQLGRPLLQVLLLSLFSVAVN
jgi:hypothetical protein